MWRSHVGLCFKIRMVLNLRALLVWDVSLKRKDFAVSCRHGVQRVPLKRKATVRNVRLDPRGFVVSCRHGLRCFPIKRKATARTVSLAHEQGKLGGLPGVTRPVGHPVIGVQVAQAPGAALVHADRPQLGLADRLCLHVLSNCRMGGPVRRPVEAGAFIDWAPQLPVQGMVAHVCQRTCA